MKNVQIFNFNEFPVRTVLKDGEPLFALTDVAAVLDIRNPSPSRFNMSEKGVHLMYTLTKGGKQELTYIDEPNLYRVIFRSRKAEAINFQNWVFDEVLPQIRKTGKYETPSDRMTDEQVGYIYNSVMRICGETGQTYQALFGMLKRAFQVASYKHIKAVDFPRACELIGVPVPVFASRAEQVSVNQTAPAYLNETDVWNVIDLWIKLRMLSNFMRIYMLPALKTLNSGLYAQAYTLTYDPTSTLNMTQKPLHAMAMHFAEQKLVNNSTLGWDRRLVWLEVKQLDTVQEKY